MKFLRLFRFFKSHPDKAEFKQPGQENAEHKEKLSGEGKRAGQKRSIVSGQENQAKGSFLYAKKEEKGEGQEETSILQGKKKIGEILIEHNLITKEVLAKALAYREKCGCSITQYLLAYGYIDEAQLAQCLCTQFGIPYLPLNSYDISDEIIKLVPLDIAQKYWLIPVDKRGDALMIVMVDPLDAKAIKEVEDITGYKVMPFVGIISEIVEALEVYYKISVKEKGAKSGKMPPFFIDTKNYQGIERRRSVRFNTKIDVQFPVNGYYKKSQTKNLSRGGLSFDSEDSFAPGTFISLEINLPKEFSPLPILAIAQVVRAVLLEDNKFEICTKLIKISKQELTTLIEYASMHNEE